MVDTERLRIMRCQKKYFSASDFAKALGMNPANYRNRERGEVAFSVEEIVRVCGLLGISLEEGVSFLT